MATINLTQLKKEKEAKPASSFNNAPTIVLNKGKSSVETPRTNYDFSDRTAEPVQRKTLQTPVVTTPQTTTVNQQINRPAQQDQYGLWDNAGYVVEQAGKGLQGGIGGLVNAASTFLDKPLQTVNALGNFGSKFSASNDYSQYDPATAEALRQKDAEIEQLRRQMYGNLDENFLDPIAQKGVDLGAGMIAESQESNYDRDKLSGVGRFTGDVAKAVTGMAPSLAVGAVAGPGAGLAVMGTGAYGQSLQQALNDGASYDDAVVYGLASAGVEIATEKLFGGIPFFGEGAVDDVLKEWMQAKLGTGTGKKVVEYLVDSIGEGAEEYISEVAGEFLVDIYTDERKDKDFFDRLMDVQDDAFYSFLLGAVTGGVMGAPGTILQSIKSGKTQEQPAEVQKTSTEKDPMKAMINESAKAEAQKIVEKPSETEFDNNFLEKGLKSDNVAVKMEAQRLNEKKIRKLYENRKSTKEQINDIVKTMNSLGVPASVLEDYIEFDALGAASSKGIELSKKADKGITRVAVHEIKHLASTSGINNQLSQVLRSLAEMDGIDLDKSRENIVKEYAKRKKALDNAAVEEELDAYIAQEYLFTEHGIKGLVRSNLTLAEKVKQLIRNIRIRISGTEFEKQLLKAEQLYTEAINEVSKSQSYKTDTERRNMYAGEKAKHADMSALDKAKLMERFKRDPDDIWYETGWIKKQDGKWRFEIDDSKAKFNFDVMKEKMFPTLKEVLDHPTLYENYPHLADMEVYYNADTSGVGGSYDRTFNSIWLNKYISNDVEQLKSILLHEVQHAIQNYEGFQGGSNLTRARQDIEDENFRTRFLYNITDGFVDDYEDYRKLLDERKELAEKYGGEHNIPKNISEENLYKIESAIVKSDFKYGMDSFSKYQKANTPVKDSQVFDRYWKTLGEVEARNTSERMEYDAADRHLITPETEGYVTDSKGNSYSIEDVKTIKKISSNAFNEDGSFKSISEQVKDILNNKVLQNVHLVCGKTPIEYERYGLDSNKLLTMKQSIIRRKFGYHNLTPELVEEVIESPDKIILGINRNDGRTSLIFDVKDSDGNFMLMALNPNSKMASNTVDVVEIRSLYGKENVYELIEDEIKHGSTIITNEKSRRFLNLAQFNMGGKTSAYTDIIYDSSENNNKSYSISSDILKRKQFDIIQANNPMTDNYHVGIRSVNDIKTFEEAMQDDESFVWGDFSLEDAQDALEQGEVTVYSSKPMNQGDFVSTSYNQARDYAGGGKVYSKVMKLSDIAWINGDEGQVARVTSDVDSNGRKLTKKQQEYFKDSKVRDENGNLLVMYHGTNSDFNIFSLDKGGQSNNNASIGFWFTPNKNGAENFAREVWYGDRDEPAIIEAYLNIKNPKVYESVDNTLEIEKLRLEYAQMKKEAENLRNSKDFVPEFIVKYGGLSGDELESAKKTLYKFNSLISAAEQAYKKIAILNRSDSYDLFRADVLEMVDEDASNIDRMFGKNGKMIDYNTGVNLLRNKLLEQGYDGIIIKSTTYDRDVMGGINDQYVVFNSNQIKRVTNTEPTTNDDIRFAIGESMLERSKDPAVRARAQMEKRIRHTFLFNKKSNPLKMYDVTSRIEEEFERTGKISDDLRKELFATAYEETLRSSDVPYKELPEFKQMLQEDLNRAVLQYENTLIKERELKKFAEENDIDASQIKFNPSTGFLKNVKPEELPDKIISYKKLKASLKSDLINQVDKYAGGKVIDELIDKAAIEIVEDGFISSPTKFEIRQEMIKNGYSINAEAMTDNIELYDFIKSTKFNVPRGFGREIQDFDRTKKLLKTSTQDGQPIDTVYKELRSRFGEFFPDDLTNPADQYQQIADVMAELEPSRLMLEDSEQYNAEMRQYLEDNFSDRLEDFKNQILYRSQKDYYDRAAKKQVAYDEAMNQVSEKISEKFFKENKDIDELQKSEHVIKSASIEDLSEVIAKIQDRGALSKTLAQNLDAMANGDVMLRAKLSEIFEKPLREAKKTYVTNQKRVLNDVYKRIVTDLGIKMGSKESAAMMWYGEGEKQLNKVKGKVESDKLEFTKYTLDDLKKDFPKTWQNIVEADKIMRKYYDEYVDRINESLEKVYSESVLKESVNERLTQLQKDIREAQERLEQLKAQRTGEVGGPDLEARINAQRKRITDLSRQFNNVAEDVYRNKRLKKRSDYYHHFQEVGFAENIQQILNVDSANNIANALAGISEYTKPKSKWEKFMQRRSNAARYEEDAIKGFLKYSPAAEYKISFDPYVAQMRGTIQDMIKLSDEANLNNAKAINWLTNYTNSLAGKTNPMDRWLTHTESGRTVLQLLNKVNSLVKGNAVVGNLNSAVSQFYNLPNGLAVLTDAGGAQSALDVAKGSVDYSAYVAKKISGQDVSDNPINQSVFLAERYIDSTIDQFDERIIHKPAQAATFLLTFGDQVVAEQLWFSAYNQALRLGKNDPISYADDLVARAVGGRGIGEVPLMQQSQVVKLIAPFQVEVNNAYQLMKQMGGSALKDKNKALGLLVMYGMTWLMNEINEALTGNRVGMDIFNAIEDAVKNWDPEKNLVANTFNSAGRLGGEILSNVPMGAQIAQMVVSDEYDREKLFGEADPSRFNTGNIGINALMDPAVQLATGQNVDWQSLVTNFVTPYGGKQLNRFYKMAEDIGLIPRVDFNINDGLQASWKPGAYNDKGQLKYQIDTSDPLNVMKGFAFGTYATNEGKEYLDNEYSALSEKKTTLYETAVEAGADPVEFYNALREANYSRNLVDKNGESIDNSKAAMNREALERNNSFDEVKKLIESGQAKASDFGLTKAVFEWTQEEFNKFMKSLDK